MRILEKPHLKRVAFKPSPFNSFDRCIFSSQNLCEKGCLRFDNINIKKIRFDKGAFIFHSGEPFTYLHSLRSGYVKLEYLFENGDSQIARFHIPGDYFGLVGATNGLHRFNAIAMTDIEVTAIDSLALKQLLATKPNVNEMIQDGMSERLASMAQHFFYLSSYSIEKRLAKFLVDFQNRLHLVNHDNPWLKLPMSRDDLKNYLGMTMESLSRAFSYLEKDNCFKVKNRMITQIDFRRLQKIIDSN